MDELALPCIEVDAFGEAMVRHWSCFATWARPGLRLEVEVSATLRAGATARVREHWTAAGSAWTSPATTFTAWPGEELEAAMAPFSDQDTLTLTLTLARWHDEANYFLVRARRLAHHFAETRTVDRAGQAELQAEWAAWPGFAWTAP